MNVVQSLICDDEPLGYVQKIICIIYVTYQIPFPWQRASVSKRSKRQNFKMAIWLTALISVLFVVIHFAGVTWAANAARNREITANSTCGSPPEIFYSVVERKKSPRYRIKSYCNATDSILSHNASKMVDGKYETWWQSSASIDKVSITIDLRGEYQKVRYEFRKLIYADIDRLP